MADLKITVDDSALRRALEVAPVRVMRDMNVSLRRTAVMTQRLFRTEMPVGATGSLRRGVQYNFSSLLSVAIYPTSRHAEYVEHGTKPHWTSVKNLERWAKMKGINPYAVQRGIARHGTRPQPFLHKVYEGAGAYGVKDMEMQINKTVNEVL